MWLELTYIAFFGVIVWLCGGLLLSWCYNGFQKCEGLDDKVVAGSGIVMGTVLVFAGSTVAISAIWKIWCLVILNIW